jgi:hypothetical protein
MVFGAKQNVFERGAWFVEGMSKRMAGRGSARRDWAFGNHSQDGVSNFVSSGRI